VQTFASIKQTFAQHFETFVPIKTNVAIILEYKCPEKKRNFDLKKSAPAGMIGVYFNLQAHIAEGQSTCVKHSRTF
jgi:hypothetical protein